MESSKENIKELLLLSKIKNTNEKIKWLLLGSFLFTLMASMLTGLTLFSRYISNMSQTKPEDIVVKVQVPQAQQMPMTFMNPAVINWPLTTQPSSEEPKELATATTVKSTPRPTKPRYSSKPTLKVKHHKVKTKNKPIWWAKGIREIITTRNMLPSVNSKITTKPITDNKTTTITNKGYIKIGDNLYFDPKTSKYVPK